MKKYSSKEKLNSVKFRFEVKDERGFVLEKERKFVGRQMRVSNIIIFQTRNVSRDTYKIMGKWKDSTGITCWTDKLYNFQDICSVSNSVYSQGFC